MNTKNISKRKLYIVDLILFVFLFSLDRYSKYCALKILKNHPSISVIPGVLELNYLENPGAAFGILENERLFFIFVSFIAVLTCLYCVIRFPAKKKYTISNILLVFIISGIVGNVTDRLIYGCVTDFIYFTIINFPIFNIADIFVSVPSILIIILLLFYYKEDDLNFLRFVEKKIRDVDGMNK